MSNKTKQITGFILLFIILIIIKIFLGGTHLYLGELLLEILVLLIISFIYMIVPLIFKLINKKRIESPKGKIIYLLNSFILFILFSTPNLLTILKGNRSDQIMSIDPIAFSKSLIILFFMISIIYYFINICFFVDNKK